MAELTTHRYLSADLTPRVAHYPRAQLSDLLGNVARNLYFAEQHHARMVLEQSYGYTMRDRQTDAGVQRAGLHTTFFALARGRRTIPRATSHLVAWCTLAVHDLQQTTVHLQIEVVDDAAGSHVGTADHLSDQIVIGVPALTEVQRRQNQAAHPFTDGARVYQWPVEVSLSGLVPGRSLIEVRGWAERLGAARTLQPLRIVVWAEDR